MSETSVIAILASVGIVLAGTVSADATALALAVQSAEPTALVNFVRQYPDSPLAPDALILAAEATADKTSDSAVSPDNTNLTCQLQIARDGSGKAHVTWATTGAVAMYLEPLGFKKGQAIPPSGSKDIDFSKWVRVSLIATDAAGNTVSCSVVLTSAWLPQAGLASTGVVTVPMSV